MHQVCNRGGLYLCDCVLHLICWSLRDNSGLSRPYWQCRHPNKLCRPSNMTFSSGWQGHLNVTVRSGTRSSACSSGKPPPNHDACETWLCRLCFAHNSLPHYRPYFIADQASLEIIPCRPVSVLRVSTTSLAQLFHSFMLHYIINVSCHSFQTAIDGVFHVAL